MPDTDQMPPSKTIILKDGPNIPVELNWILRRHGVCFQKERYRDKQHAGTWGRSHTLERWLQDWE